MADMTINSTDDGLLKQNMQTVESSRQAVNDALQTQQAAGGNNNGLLQPAQSFEYKPLSQEQIQSVAAPQYVNTAQEETVESRLTNLLSKENPYLKQAEGFGRQQANARGLLNTSMGIQAVERERISAALPIAQQDAQFYQQRNLQGQQGEIQSFISGQGAVQEAGLTDLKGRVSSELSRQDLFNQQTVQSQSDTAAMARLGLELDSRERLQKMGDTAAMERLDKEAQHRAQLQTQIEQAAADRLQTDWGFRNEADAIQRLHETTINEVNNQARRDLAQMDIDEAQKARGESALLGVQSEYMNAHLNLLLNEKATKDDFDRLAQTYMSNAATVSSIYGIPLEYGAAPPGSPGSPGIPGTPGSPGTATGNTEITKPTRMADKASPYEPGSQEDAAYWEGANAYGKSKKDTKRYLNLTTKPKNNPYRDGDPRQAIWLEGVHAALRAAK